MDIRALRPDDDRSGFRSGDPDLDRFFQKYAGQNQFRHHLGVTYVAVEQGRILGFVTISPGHLESEALTAVLRRKLPRYPVPILRLARLAVDETCRRKGVGGQLLGSVFELALKMTNDYGCAGIVADAKPDAVEFYRKYGFREKTAIAGDLRGQPRPIAMLLPTGTLRKA